MVLFIYSFSKCQQYTCEFSLVFAYREKLVNADLSQVLSLCEKVFK